MSLPHTVSLMTAKNWLRARVDKGERCPCCGQFAKVYRRKINAGMARSLILMYRVGGQGWVHVPTQIGARSREEGKLAYWGLVEEETATRPDGGRAGYWRVTPLGELFVLGKVRVYKYARIYDGKVIGMDVTTQVGILDALGTRFDYAELMSS